jgi:hypothetical protein
VQHIFFFTCKQCLLGLFSDRGNEQRAWSVDESTHGQVEGEERPEDKEEG